MPRSPRIYIEIWTEHFLGTKEKCVALLDLLETMDDARWVPEKWNECEPVRKAYAPEFRDQICSKWTKNRGITANYLFFRKKKPYMQAWAECWQGHVPSLNKISLEFEAKAFSTSDGVDRLIALFLQFVDWSQAVYGCARRSGQLHGRWAQGTPLDRLTNASWLNFFGQPYLDLFGGKERVLAAPCYRAEPTSDGVLLLASPRSDSPEMAGSDAVLTKLEAYLGRDAFIAEDYSDIPCRLPKFDLSETVVLPSLESEERDETKFKSPLTIRNRRTKQPIAVVVLSSPETETN